MTKRLKDIEDESNMPLNQNSEGEKSENETISEDITRWKGIFPSEGS